MLRTHFTYEAPDSVEQAVISLTTRENVVPLAGGTDLVPLLKYGVKNPDCLLDLKKIPSLKTIIPRVDGLFIGSGVTLSEIAGHPAINETFSALCRSARSVASPQIRNLATLGGNLLQERRCLYFNQSQFWRKGVSPCLKLRGEVCHQVPGSKRCRALYYSDTAPVLLAYDARAEIHDREGLKVVPLREMIRRSAAGGNGKFLLAGIVIPHPPEGTWGRFIKSGVRAAIDFATINMAVRFSPASGPKQQVPVLRIFVGALAPEPVSLDETAGYLLSNLPKLPSVEKELKERALKEMGAKSALIRETGISLKAKRNALNLVSDALNELFAKLPAL